MADNKRGLFEDIETFFEMSGKMLARKYPMRWSIVLWPLAFVLYLVSPLDFIPDYFFPIVGFGDDAAFMLFIISRLRKEVRAYRAWLENTAKQVEAAPAKKTDGKRL